MGWLDANLTALDRAVAGPCSEPTVHLGCMGCFRGLVSLDGRSTCIALPRIPATFKLGEVIFRQWNELGIVKVFVCNGTVRMDSSGA